MRNVDNKYKCLPFWSWNGELDEKKLCSQIEWMHSNGVGGFFMHARTGLTTEYLGDKWFSCIKACIEKAKELNMEAYAYDENGWPSGFVGGKLLEDIENHDIQVIKKEGPFDSNAVISYKLENNKLLKVNSGENCINIYLKPSPSTADILNPKVVDKFISETHEKYKTLDKDTKYLRGFFTDEPQYFRWGTPYTKVLAPYFKEKYGEDVLDNIGLLFIKAEGYRDYRYRYYKCMQELMLKNWAEKIYNWCDSNNYLLTGHYVEECDFGSQDMCCGGVMPFYEYEHIPGIDLLCRQPDYDVWIHGKQLGSVATQLGKKQTIVETYALCGWDVTPQELKSMGEHCYVDGVNLMCQHLLPYEEHGERKRDYPAHYSKLNPWVNANFGQFNDYFSVLGEILSKSKEEARVGVLHPIRSSYLDYQDDAFHQGLNEDSKPVWDLTSKFITECAGVLQANHICHHYLDETLLAKHGKVVGDKLILGLCAYDYIVIPEIITMDKTTYDLLKQYCANGGKVWIMKNKPTYLEGKPFDGYDWLVSNCGLVDLIKAQPYKFNGGNKTIMTYHVGDDEVPFIYAVAFEEAQDIEIVFDGYKGTKAYDILEDKYIEKGTHIHLEPREAVVLYPSNELVKEKEKLESIYLGDTFHIEGEVENLLMIDNVRYSTDDGITYSEPLNYMGIFNELLKARFKGKLLLKYEFNVKDIPSKCELMCEDVAFKSLNVNGKNIIPSGRWEDEEHFLISDIASCIVKGHNEAVIELDYYQDDHVYYVLFEANDTESLKNCLAYSCNIEAIYLRGNFGVYGDFKPGQDKNIILGENFYLGTQKKDVKSLILDGYPFFRGPIKLSQDLLVNSISKQLEITKRFQLIDIELNGKFVKRLMFDNKVDLSSHLKVGHNDLIITLYVSNRNSFGPFHTDYVEDSPAVGPATWERFGTWTNGKSKYFRDNYSFVKTII